MYQYYQGGEFQGDDHMKAISFDDASIRRGFIRKVYLILMAQLLITFAFISVFTFSPAAQQWVQRNPAILFIALIVMIVTIISMACCESVRRNSPLNYIFLFLFTFVEALFLGIISGQYEVKEVLMAVGITAAISLGLTLFALQTKYDFTMMGGVLVALLITFIIFGIIAIFISGNIIGLIYASLGALLFSMYLIYDTQLMLGGKHRYAISPEEYIFAALNLYLDICNIFIYILSIIGAVRK